MFSRIKQWYGGESKVKEFDNDPSSLLVILPQVYTEYHWSAKIARAVIGFYRSHWSWLWSTILAVLGVYFAFLALK